MVTPRELQVLYEQGNNISEYLRSQAGVAHNTREMIELTYDLQAGSYIELLQNEELARHARQYAAEIARRVLALCRPTSILEAGVGEATILSGVLTSLNYELQSFAFDLSWSRIAYSRRWLRQNGFANTRLCTGDFFQVPFLDNSIDVVYTSHSIESNGGNEEPILRELYRITRKYLILLEPGYELASDEARARMDAKGYCKNLKGVSQSLGYDVLEHELFPFSANPMNPTAITVIRKPARQDDRGEMREHLTDFIACPRSKTPLKLIGDTLYSPESLVVYPVIGGIPCLRIENSVLASKYEEFLGS